MTAGSSAGSGSAVASNIAAIAITEDTGKSRLSYNDHRYHTF